MQKTKAEWLGFYRDLACRAGGECLSKEYKDAKTKLKWRCEDGHEWSALPYNVKKGHWCAICGNVRQGVKKSKGIAFALELATRNNGKCLSHLYKNNREKLEWECAKGHKWFASAHSVDNGSWCPVCAGKLPKDLALQELQKLANSRGGSCESKSYKDVKTKLLWRCSKGHQWMAIPETVKLGTWCPQCAGNQRLSLDEMKFSAELMGGECLSEEYVNSDQKLKWRCAEGHEWEAVGYHVRAGHWCPVCTSGSSERICRDVFEQLFNQKFPKAWPAWLVNQKGNRMELDGFCSNLSIAFEYHGVQHFKEQKFFHRTESALVNRIADDKQKRLLCRSNGVKLIEVPFDIPLKDLPGYIEMRLGKRLKPLQAKPASEVEVAKFVLPEKLKAMQLLAARRGGECLSNAYINNSSKLHWRCAKGHEWEAAPSSVQSGSWCPRCIGKLPPDFAIKELQSIASLKGGACLSHTYLSGKVKLQWRCAKGHIWWATPAGIRNGGAWCPECAKKTRGPARLGLDRCKQVAKEKGGECLSQEYKNTDTKLRWRCGQGHEWEAIPDSVVRLGTWCPKCKGKLVWATRRRNATNAK